MATATKPAVEGQEDAPLHTDTTVANALIIKRAYHAGGSFGPKPVIVMANGQVVFTQSDNMQLGMKFSLEEWNRIVDFVDGQLLEAHQLVAIWRPKWATIPANFNYVAVDKDGDVWAYESQPEVDHHYEEWLYSDKASSDDAAELTNQIVPTGLDWTQSLCIRPGVSL